jgi:CheY-like chemotaxis protein
MPGTDGLDLLIQLKRERPKTPVVMLTMYSADQFGNWRRMWCATVSPTDVASVVGG